MTVLLFKLITGEDVVAELLEETEHTYIVSHPLKTLSLNYDNGSPIVGFTSWLPLCVIDEIDILKHQVVAVVEVDSILEEIYFGSVVKINAQVTNTKNAYLNIKDEEEEFIKKTYH